MNRIYNIPNFLTFIRLAFGPLFLPFLIVYFLPYNNFFINLAISITFVLISLTDFFDGYLARKYNIETKLGKALDPIADKFFMASILISLVAVDALNFFWVNLLILREFFIMGLRQIALENNFSVNVSFYGKLKTTFQIIMITSILLAPYSNFYSLFGILQLLFINITVFISIISAYLYFQSFYKYLNYK